MWCDDECNIQGIGHLCAERTFSANSSTNGLVRMHQLASVPIHSSQVCGATHLHLPSMMWATKGLFKPHTKSNVSLRANAATVCINCLDTNSLCWQGDVPVGPVSHHWT